MHAAESDATAPVLVNATVTREVIDVVDGPVDVTLRVEAEDLGSGINPDSFTIDPDPDYGNGRDPVKAKVMTLVSGDHNRGIYEATFTFPELILNGDWTYNAVVRDNAGNANYDYNGSATGGVLQRTTTVQSSPDREAPVVTTEASARLIDVTDGPASLKFTAEAHDQGVGIAADEIVFFRTGMWGGGYYLTNMSTDPNVARFEATVVVQQYSTQQDPRGTFSTYFDSVADSNGNASPRILAGTYTVGTRPLRAKRPNLVVEGLNLKTSWAAQADPMGVLEYEVELTSSEQTKTVKTTALEVPHSDLPAGTYTARVRARNQLGWGEWTTPSAPVVYTLAQLTTSTPAVSGAVKVGQTLTANPGTWTQGATLAYQWLAGGVAVNGATDRTLVLGPGQAGKTIAVQVTGSKAGYTPATRTSEATAKVISEATPAAVTFTDKDGTKDDSYTVPATAGVDYLVGGAAKPAGTYPGTGTVTVTAKAKTDYILAAGATASWTATFSSGVAPTAPAVPGASKRLNDFTNDGKTDVIARDASGQLWLYPGTGSGDWLKRIDLGGGWNVMSSIVSAGDFNGDSKADVIARDTSGQLWLYPGTGNGDWSKRQHMGGGWNVMTSIVAPGDFNADGRPDLIARDSSGELWLYPNNGAGDWLKRVDLGPGWNIMSSIVAPGDFNADGKVDLVARDTSGRLWLYPGNGQNEWFKRVDLGAGWNTMNAITAPGDMDSDGRPDVIARDTTGELWLYPNNGKGDWHKRIDLGPGWNPMSAIL